MGDLLALGRNESERVKNGSGTWTRTKILGSKGPRATNCTIPEWRRKCSRQRANLFPVDTLRRSAVCRWCVNLLGFLSRLLAHQRGEVSERFKEHAWKACVGETQPWVRIPPSPPYIKR